jgi:chromosome segregation ATPase
MAEVTRLSVNQALDKLRRDGEVSESKMARLDGQIDTLDEEIQRLRATNRRLERDQRANLTDGEAWDSSSPRHIAVLKILGIIIGVIVIVIVAWKWMLL